ncbi:GGDEF domain-containing protein [Simiduia aestuariiviva]|uniref:diguanylate cyclase n=1 Tax=Simiduia aestuariiviva TaxID=1510459 RepID=A0A839USI1_9GAMM|nr:GGDEF domain-containing protein [Simiduia aestuariiviva]MBB3168876.1 diguanylate cyclase (GGDEF)-like protein [Simiduia aestuariiviva]
MNYVVEIEPSANTGIYLTNDIHEGGKSEGALLIEEGFAELKCKTHTSAVFAYCGFLVPLRDPETGLGLNLSYFTSLSFDLTFDSDVRDTVLIYLHGEEFRMGESRTRIHMQPINPMPGMAHYHLELSDFFIPSWWLLYFAQDQSDSGTNLRNVIGLQITTGDNRTEKNTRLALGNIELKGKWIYAGQLYFYLLLGGLAIVLIRGLTSAFRYRAKYLESRERSAELYKLNKLLSVERDKFENLSKTDPLTGCINRAGARELLERLVCIAPTEGPKAALILLDIDHFKQINDSYGHEEGDRVLVELAAYLRSRSRNEDAVVRWGGEEFAIICPQTSGQQASLLAEHLRTRLPEVIAVQAKGITCSFGVAEFVGSGVEAWFRRADAALYQAKAEGRHRVVLAD